MNIPLIVKTDYSLLNSLIKIDDLIKHCQSKNVNIISICDTNLFGSSEFYIKCTTNNIKPLIGLEIKLLNTKIYLFAKNYFGYQKLILLNEIKEKREVNFNDLINSSLLCIIKYSDNRLYNELDRIFSDDLYVGYNNTNDAKNSLILSKNSLFINEVLSLSKGDIPYLKYLYKINDVDININCYKNAYYDYNISNSNEILNDFISKINLIIPLDNKYLPIYDKNLSVPFKHLTNLCVKGLIKRLDNNVSTLYKSRLLYELDVVKKMGFVDYFLIVYDYVLFAKKNNIMVGPGRGSAAGSLIAYSLGITNVDPLKYNLIFERFLNEDRVSMPDIDIDFEDDKRDIVKEYVKEKYGKEYVGNIITFATLSTKQVLLDLIDVLKINTVNTKTFLKLIDSKKTLSNNLNTKEITTILSIDDKLKNVYKIAMHLEGLKKFTSIHAAGLVISPYKLNTVIPVIDNRGSLTIGCTMNYLERMGLLKMDFLGLNNLSIIHNCLDIIPDDIDINNIPLDDPHTFNIFSTGDTLGIFQFESDGIKNFISSLKPTKLSDLYVALAMYRPGPMNNIDKFIKRKNGLEPITYIHDDLKPILSDTYGIIVYQEQIMSILNVIGGYSFKEADSVRKSISKKNEEYLKNEKSRFIERSVARGYDEDIASNIFNLILKFASFGFNKSHSVAYSLICYLLAYLKAHYFQYFIINFLNRSIGSAKATKEYIAYAMKRKLELVKCNISISTDFYYINDNKIIVPLSIIKGMNSKNISIIINARYEKKFTSIFDFVCRCKNAINENTFKNMILAGCFDEFYNRKTLIHNIDTIMNYSFLKINDSVDVPIPLIEEENEYDLSELLECEAYSCGLFLSNHPTIPYYNNSYTKLCDITNYFDKYITAVVLIDKVKEITTSNNKKMYFIDASDDTGNMDFILFDNRNNLLYKIIKGKILIIKGKVTRRNSKYDIIISDVKNIEE